HWARIRQVTGIVQLGGLRIAGGSVVKEQDVVCSCDDVCPATWASPGAEIDVIASARQFADRLVVVGLIVKKESFSVAWYDCDIGRGSGILEVTGIVDCASSNRRGTEGGWRPAEAPAVVTCGGMPRHATVDRDLYAADLAA